MYRWATNNLLNWIWCSSQSVKKSPADIIMMKLMLSMFFAYVVEVENISLGMEEKLNS